MPLIARDQSQKNTIVPDQRNSRYGVKTCLFGQFATYGESYLYVQSEIRINITSIYVVNILLTEILEEDG